LLNNDNLEELAEAHGTSMAVTANYTDHLGWLATSKVRLLLSDLLKDRDYVYKAQEGNISFLRTDRAFDKCMEMAYKKWRWVHKKLG
jgi:hypothetical protein